MTAKQLCKLRKQKGLQAVFIADKLGLHPARLSEMENGRRTMPADVATAYEGLLK